VTREEFRGWLKKRYARGAVRRRVHRGAAVFCGAFAVVVALALFRPGLYTVGPVVIKLTSLRNPLLELGAAALVYLATSNRFFSMRLEAPRTLVRLWSGWTAGGRIFAAALALKLGVTVVNLARLPDQYLFNHRAARARLHEPLEKIFARKDRHAQFESFFERCRAELPADARVLYEGRAEGQLLAYVLYPRPVFMLPADRWVAWIGHQVLDHGALPDDELFPSALPPPLATPSRESFVATHGITHEVRFVESDLENCRIRAVQ
jgi:hypothetical protein